MPSLAATGVAVAIALFRFKVRVITVVLACGVIGLAGRLVVPRVAFCQHQLLTLLMLPHVNRRPK
ncbi:hypothetical protein CUJ91_31220 [Paraburkholderia graminis]|nr:hypothetical protein CUJ91_31220 [Paraburkholderia graminis]